MCTDFVRTLAIIISAVFLVSGQTLTAVGEALDSEPIVSAQIATKEVLSNATVIANGSTSTEASIGTTIVAAEDITGHQEQSTFSLDEVTDHIESDSPFAKETKEQIKVQTTTSAATKPPNIFSTTTEKVAAESFKVEIVDKCSDLSTTDDLDALTQNDFMSKLTDSCRYDRLVKPKTDEPVIVYMQIDMNHVETADHLQLKAHIMVQLLYKDIRLDYSQLSPKRGNIVGEEALRSQIWVPHIVVENERESSLMGLSNRDVFFQISPDGNVFYSYRMTTTFYCWMNLEKFPFDHQVCSIKWVSWAYNATNLELRWEPNKPFIVAKNLHLTEYVIENQWNDSSVEPASFLTGGLAGNYSAVIFYFKLRREVGYYIMDYFLPSILLVCMSWVTFWLQADASPPRVTLGASTMLSFITLNGGLTKNLPKVSYIKASEIWFIGCTTFIFFSLAEFAFVNVIWRRRKRVQLKKQNSKHILRGALTPSLARKQLKKVESCNTLFKTRSCSSLDKMDSVKNTEMNYLTVHGFPSSFNVPKITTQEEAVDDSFTTITIPEDPSRPSTPPQQTWTTMTPQEIAIWIDRKSRIVFPVAFLIFNIIYWFFVYVIV